MRRSVLLSITFHVVVFALIGITIPYFAKDIEPVEMAITVELADLAEVSQTDKKLPPPKPVYNNTDSPPDLIEPKELEAAQDIPMPPKDEPKADKEVIKKPPPKPRNKPRFEKKPKPDPPKEQKKVKKDKKDFTSLLKSLTPDEPEQETPLESPQAQDPQEEISQIADFSKQMTRSEMDDLNRGVEPCWNINAGGRDAHKLIVELMVFVNQDRTVREVKIIDQMNYNSDSHFRAAAEAARRALLNPRCSTLNLPPEKYERWKKFRYIFNPSSML